jgi:3-oxoadipate enol-lactonase
VMTAIADLPPATTGAHSADRYFISDGARLRYRDEGQGPTVVLVHGWTLDLEMWEPQVAALRGAFRLVRLDRRGFGLSSGVPVLDRDIADVEALCRHLGLGSVALIGMSQGARVVLGLAVAVPNRVSCLVLDGPPGFDRGAASDDDVPLAEYRALIRTRGIDALRSAWAMHPLTQLRTGDRRVRELLKSIIARYPGTDLLETPASHGTIHAPIQPESVATPALIITGEHDLPGRVIAADTLARHLPYAERAVIPGAGHLPNLDSPDAYNNLVRAFLNRHAAALT